MSCCELMTRALEYSAQREVRPPGLHTQQLFNTVTMQPTRALVLYRVPGHGRGKDRVEPQTFVVKNCPFCGRPTGIKAELRRLARTKSTGEASK